MFFYIIFIIFGFYLLLKGADFLVDGASNLAKKFNIPSMIIGLTIIAIGTSMPELMVSFTAAIQKHSDISIGNIVGSNMANLFLILGVCSIIHPLKFNKKAERVDNLIAVFATLFVFFLGNNTNKHIITKEEGCFLLFFAIIYIIYNIFFTKKEKSKEDKDNYKKISIIKTLIYVLIGIFSLKIGGDVVVKYSSKVAKILGVSEKIISITVIAFSTSFPELITSINATIKRDTDMAIGNILGSQIFNIFLILGISSIFEPIDYSINYNIDMFFLICGTIMFAIFPFIGTKHYMTRTNGIFFVLIYVSYIIYNIVKIN